MDKKYEAQIKPVRADIGCPKCGESITGYLTKDFGNEKCTLVCEHKRERDDGMLVTYRCQMEVDLLVAHQFEARSLNKYDFGRKW